MISFIGYAAKLYAKTITGIFPFFKKRFASFKSKAESFLRAGTLKPGHFIITSAFFILLFLGGHIILQGFVYVVYIEDRAIGKVKQAEDVEGFLCELAGKCSDIYGLEMEPVETITLLRKYSPGSKIAATEVQEQIRGEITFKTEAHMITVNGKPLAAVASKDDLKRIQVILKQSYFDTNASQNMEDSDGEVKLSSEIKLLNAFINESLGVVPCRVEAREIMDADQVIEKLLSQKEELDRKAADGSFYSNRGAISSRHISRFDASGLTAAENDPGNNLLPENRPKTFSEYVEINVTTIEEIKVMKKVPYEVERLEDDRMWVVENKIETPGKHGIKEVTYHVIRENGEEIEMTRFKERVIEEPVTQVEVYGTAQVPAKGSGRFIWPVQGGGEVTPGRGFSSWHTGIDIDTSAGTNVLAADSGVVWFSGFGRTQGNYLIIYHGNYWTLYLHNETNLVSEGDKVSQGDIIARVGSTGRTTGAHLHFEVRRDDGTGEWLAYYQHQPVDPLRFFNP